ncbi:MAG: Fic family protein [Oscillospiraceae bacterium]|nr:Fic family protein [Oscillospiraceae bacterium]
MGVYSVQGTPKYCYPGTTVLINRLGLRDQEELDRVERQIVLLKSTIAEREMPFTAVDFLYYLDLHRMLFGELYDWAGQIRDIDITKKGTVFYPARDIERLGELRFRRLARENYLCGLERAAFAEALAELYHDLNMLHPFREGNGRTERLFLTLLVRHAGYAISFAECDRDLLNIAAIRAAQGDLSLLREVLSDMIHENHNP